jgi:hypothetical protein
LRKLSKRMFKPLFSFLLFSFTFLGAYAQELNCTVQVLSPQIQGTDKRIFETFQSAIYEFMNNRRWTDDQFLNQERIECNILINVTKRHSNDEFEGTIQVQSRRPVYKSSYNSPLLNHLDESFSFRYLEYQPLEFNDNSHLTNLTSVLAFYAYVIIGYDYDSYGLLGGTPVFLKAQNIVNNAQNVSEKGWKAFENSKNRYWVAENLLNPTFKPLRESMYKFHRKGLDIMTEKKDDARLEITESIESLRKIHRDKPGSLLMTMFFNAKSDELVNIYSKAFPDEKSKIVSLLGEIDPANTSKYQRISSNR